MFAEAESSGEVRSVAEADRKGVEVWLTGRTLPWVECSPARSMVVVVDVDVEKSREAAGERVSREQERRCFDGGGARKQRHNGDMGSRVRGGGHGRAGKRASVAAHGPTAAPPPIRLAHPLHPREASSFSSLDSGSPLALLTACNLWASAAPPLQSPSDWRSAASLLSSQSSKIHRASLLHTLMPYQRMSGDRLAGCVAVAKAARPVVRRSVS